MNKLKFEELQKSLENSQNNIKSFGEENCSFKIAVESLENKKLETDLNKEKDEVKNYKKVLRYHKVKSSA